MVSVNFSEYPHTLANMAKQISMCKIVVVILFMCTMLVIVHVSISILLSLRNFSNLLYCINFFFHSLVSETSTGYCSAGGGVNVAFEGGVVSMISAKCRLRLSPIRILPPFHEALCPAGIVIVPVPQHTILFRKIFTATVAMPLGMATCVMSSRPSTWLYMIIPFILVLGVAIHS